jgi:hypothetical protein
MSLSFVIEIGGDAVGLVHRYEAHEAYRFFAADPRLSALEGAVYGRPSLAEAAARSLLAARRKPMVKHQKGVLFDERFASPGAAGF